MGWTLPDFSICHKRYIEGDFHHLKHSKIGRSPLLPRQFSMGGPGSPMLDRVFLDHAHIRFSLDERHSATSGGGNVSGGTPNALTLSHESHSLDAQLLQFQHQFQQNKQQRQQQLLRQAAAAVALMPSNSCETSPRPGGISPRLSQEMANYSTLQSQGSKESRRSSTDREPPSPRLLPRVPSAEPFRQVSGENLEASPPSLRRGGRSARNSPSPTPLHILRDMGSSGNVANSSNLSPSPPFKPLQYYEINPARRSPHRRPSPLAALTPAGSDCGSGNSSIFPTVRDSPPSPFRPIQDYTAGSSPSPPYRPVRTQVAVEVHQLQQSSINNSSSSNTITNANDGSSLGGGNSSEDQQNHLAKRLDRARAFVQDSASSPSSSGQPLAVSPSARIKSLSPKPYHQNNAGSHQCRSLANNTPSSMSCRPGVMPVIVVPMEHCFLRNTNDGLTHSFHDSDRSPKDYDILNITEFSQGPFHMAACDLSPEGEGSSESGVRRKVMVRYNDTGSLEKLNEEEDHNMDFEKSTQQQRLSPTNQRAEAASLVVPGSVPRGSSPSCNWCNHRSHQHQHHHHSDHNGDQAEPVCPADNTGHGAAAAAAENRTSRRYRALWRLRATLEEEEECSDTLRMEDLTTSPDDESPERGEDGGNATTETNNTTSFESNNAHSDPCPSDHRDSGVQFENCSSSPGGGSHRGGNPPQGGGNNQADNNNHNSGAGNQHGAHSPGGHSARLNGGAEGASNNLTVGLPNQGYLLHPNYESRRQNYRAVLSHRYRVGVSPHRGAPGTNNSLDETSFDSIETDGDGDGDGEVSDTSRPEVTSTSFESSTTTDNTDSTTESQSSKLRQMKADSGYKSLETQQQTSRDASVVEVDGAVVKLDSRASSVDIGDGIAARRDSRGTAVDSCFHPLNLVKGGSRRDSAGSSAMGNHHKQLSPRHEREKNESGSIDQKFEPKISPTGNAVSASAVPSHFLRRSGKTASKKRREFSRDRQSVQVVYESIHEPDVEGDSSVAGVSTGTNSSQQLDSPLLQPGDTPPIRSNDDSFEEESSLPNKISVFARFFKSQGPRLGFGHSHRNQYLERDYSIDEKTNSIFNEFVRRDGDGPPSSLGFKNGGNNGGARGRFGFRKSPRNNRHRFQRKHTDPGYFREESEMGDSVGGPIGLRGSRTLHSGYGSSSRSRDRLAPSMRSVSLGSDSSLGSARRISPQDSIEEEDDEEIDIDEAVALAEKAGRISCSSVVTVSLETPSNKTGAPNSTVPCQNKLQEVSLYDIPIIQLPEESDREMS